MISGKDFAEKYFSQTEESEKLFSTGDSELDDLLQEVYYSGLEDGYDYAQREFAEKESKDHTTEGAAGLAAAGVGGGAIVTKAGKKRISRNAEKELKEISEVASADLEKQTKLAAQKKAKALDSVANSREQWREGSLFDRIEGKIKENRAKKAANKAIEEAESNLAKQSSRIRQTAEAAKKGVEEKAAKKIAKVSKHGKVLAGAGLVAGGALAVAGAAKHNRSSKSAQN